MPNFISPFRTAKRYFQKKYRAITQFEFNAFTQWASQFNFSQWCYFIAVFLLFSQALFAELSESDVLLVGAIAFVGLFREMWHLFQRVWEHNIGKAFVLIVYAATANFALAFAAVKINAITGIEPTPFVFTLGFTTLVMLPFWMTVSNVVLLLLALILANLLLFISIPFKLMGVHLPVHWEDKHRAGTTMLLRILLIPLVIFSLFSFISPYLNQFTNKPQGFGIEFYVDEEEGLSEAQEDKLNNMVITEEMSFSEKMSEISKALSTESNSAGAESTGASSKQQAPQAIEDSPAKLDTELSNVGESNEPSLEKQPRPDIEQSNVIHRLIADFIFYFESYPYSACKKTKTQHSIIIDENLVLLISPDTSTEIGYRYEVKPCIPVFSEQALP